MKKLIKLLVAMGALSIASAFVSSCKTQDVSTERPTNGLKYPDLASGLFSATSAEYNSPKQDPWASFSASMRQLNVYICMKNRGFSESVLSELRESASNSTLPGPDDNYNFPDIDRFKSGLFMAPTQSTKPATTAGSAFPPDLPASEQQAYESGVLDCGKAPLPEQLTKISKELDPIDIEWGKMIQAVQNDATVRSALRDWSACMARDGVQVQSQRDFFAYVDSVGQSIAQRVQGSPYRDPQMMQLAKLYGDCIGPVSNAMDQVRLRDRTQLFDKYASQLKELNVQMSNAIEALANKYGIKVAG